MKKLSNLLGTEVYSQLLWLRCSYIKLPLEIMGLSHMRIVEIYHILPLTLCPGWEPRANQLLIPSPWEHLAKSVVMTWSG